MTDPLLGHALVPVASPEDAEATGRAVFPRVAAVDGRVTALHVIEKAGGAPDKAGVEQREEYAEEVFDVVRTHAADADVPVETKLVFATDVTEAILDAARATEASAVVFTPRAGSRWLSLLSGDTSSELVKRADRPVVALPEETDE
ncbi:MAG: universal stress protein [Halobacteriaceae archaeon]